MKSTLSNILACSGLCLILPSAAFAQSGPTEEPRVVTSTEVEVDVDPAPETVNGIDTDVAEGVAVKETTSGVDDNIAGQVEASSGLSKLETALEITGLKERLAGGTPITFFAPTDTAFRKLEDSMNDPLLAPANKEKLTAILERHMVNGATMAAGLESGTLTTIGGEKIAVVVEGESYEVGGANVTMADRVASNGVIHMVDAVFEPTPMDETATADASTTTTPTAPAPASGQKLDDMTVAERAAAGENRGEESE